MKLHRILPWIFIILSLLLILSSLLASFLAPFDPLKINMAVRMAPPSWQHLLGTDVLGRDMFSRVLYGGRASIFLALAATLLSLLLGLILGILAGYFGGWVDSFITGFTSIFQGLPGTSMMVAFSAMLGQDVFSLLFALTITSWTGFSRVVRGEVMKVLPENYMEGARSMGASSLRIILRYVLPNILPNLVVLFATRTAGMILSIAGLSFLGLGIQPPTPDWGVMVSEARSTFRSAPMLLFAPGFCILLLSLGINYTAELLRERLDVRSQNIGIARM